jgi:hypothetical protein
LNLAYNRYFILISSTADPLELVYGTRGVGWINCRPTCSITKFLYSTGIPQYSFLYTRGKRNLNNIFSHNTILYRTVLLCFKDLTELVKCLQCYYTASWNLHAVLTKQTHNPHGALLCCELQSVNCYPHFVSCTESSRGTWYHCWLRHYTTNWKVVE